MAAPKNRTQLQNLFKSGAKPSEADFKDLIDGVLNIADDGIEKPAGADTPLKVLTRGDQESVLDIYAGETLTWRLNQKPTADTQGLNFETGGSSKLFVESSTGNLGLGITKPIAKLHIQQPGSQNALRIDDEASDKTPLIVDAEGKVGIGKAVPTKTLDVNGDTAIAGALSVTGNTNITRTLSVAQTSTLTGKVGIGDAPSAGTEKLKVQGDTAIAGNLSVTGGDLNLPGHIRLRRHGTQEIAYLQARDDNDKRNISLRFRTQKGDGTSRTITEAMTISPEGNTAITGHLTVSGTTNAGVLQVTKVNRTSHVTADGAIYRKGGQVYLTVDDNFYIRDSGSTQDNPSIHIDTNKKSLRVYGKIFVHDIPFGNKKNVQWDETTHQFYQDNSSRKNKENIMLLKDDFLKILQVEPKTYTRPGSPNIWEIGCIAEEFDELDLKQLVYYESDGSPGAIHYDKISLYLIEIIKDLRQRIENLEKNKLV